MSKQNYLARITDYLMEDHSFTIFFIHFFIIFIYMYMCVCVGVCMDVCNTCAGDHGKPEEGVSVLHPLELELRAPTLCSKLNSGSLETQ